VCAYRLKFARSLGEKRSEDRDLVSGPQKLEFLEGLLTCQGVREEYAPSFFWLQNIINSILLICLAALTINSGFSWIKHGKKLKTFKKLLKT